MKKIIIFDSFPVFAANAYLLVSDEHCLLIDCGYYSNEIKEEIKKYKYFDGVILTHKHFDHISGLPSLLNDYKNIDIYSYQSKDEYFKNPINNCSRSMSSRNIFNYDIKSINLSEGEITIGVFKLNIILTPGHTTDSISIVWNDDNAIFTGDFLFPYSIGRCDLPTSNVQEMRESLKKFKLLNLNQNYIMYCGHDNPCSLKNCFKINAYLQQK